MHIWRALEQVPDDLGRAVVAIGNFDGVHRGHQHLLAIARARADDLGALLVVCTFDPHPVQVLRPEHAPARLTDLRTRARLLAGHGVDDVLALPFSRDIASWTPAEFVDRVLVGALHAKAVVVGVDFRFGTRASGSVDDLVSLGSERDFTAEGIALDGGEVDGQVWSSTHVRTCLADGDVEGAALALGRSYAVRGVVEQGDQRGRELGYPTANVPVGELATPPDGVYAGWLRTVEVDPERPEDPGAEVLGERLPAAISVGTNPTFEGERKRRVEAYVLDRTDLELYGREVEVELVVRLRGMARFDGVEELLVQMAADVEGTRDRLGLR